MTTERQLHMKAFVEQHQVACFKCGSSTPDKWAKTGISARGPWAICAGCVLRSES